MVTDSNFLRQGNDRDHAVQLKNFANFTVAVPLEEGNLSSSAQTATAFSPVSMRLKGGLRAAGTGAVSAALAEAIQNGRCVQSLTFPR